MIKSPVTSLLDVFGPYLLMSMTIPITVITMTTGIAIVLPINVDHNSPNSQNDQKYLRGYIDDNLIYFPTDDLAYKNKWCK